MQTMSTVPAAVGLTIRHNAGQIEVVEAEPGTPAARAGIQPGSLLLSIDGQNLRDRPLAEVVELLQGPAGSSVELDFAAPGTAVSALKVVREPLRQQVRIVVLADGYLYVRLPQFGPDTAANLARALAQAGGQPKGLILDLRENGGGLLNSAIDLAAMFLANDQVVATLPPPRNGSDNGHIFNGTATTSGLSQKEQLPLAVLVGGDTSSGAEIIASALQDNHRAQLLGQRTQGNADIQTIIPLSGGAALKLTTNYWQRASGGSVDHSGVEPDIRVDEKDSALQSEARALPVPVRGDTEVEAALDYLRSHAIGVKS